MKSPKFYLQFHECSSSALAPTVVAASAASFPLFVFFGPSRVCTLPLGVAGRLKWSLLMAFFSLCFSLLSSLFSLHNLDISTR
jgi:hypothetical protein